MAGLAEGLRAETAHLGIRTLLIEPGRFRTNLLSSGNVKTTPSTIPEYTSLSQDHLKHLTQEDKAQRGDPAKLVEITIDLVRKEGIAKDKEIPFRLPLGADVYEDIKEKCEGTLRLLEEWKTVICSTDHAV